MRRFRLPVRPRISAVVISRNEGAHLRRTVESLSDTLPAESEILVVDDGTVDGSTDFLGGRKPRPTMLLRSMNLGVARARNWGARRAKGDVIVFADAHIVVDSEWWKPFVELLANPRIGAVAPAVVDMRRPRNKGYGLSLPRPDLEADWLERQGTEPYAVPILPGCCLAMRRDTFEVTGGFDDGLLQSGGVDNELGIRLWLLGYELLVVPATEVQHLFRRRFPYPLTWETILHNRLRLGMAHLQRKRAAKVVRALRGYAAFPSALMLTIEGRISARRSHLFSLRLHDDDWFFERFRIDW
jgi:GT2 family glycosyltransferase